MNPKISIITPSFNQSEFIERTIKSILGQGIPNLEYVVFDGGSTDNTIEVLESFKGQLKWVSEKDNGQAHAVNKGIKATTGEIVGWLNSDDIYYPGSIQKVLEFFTDNPEVDIIYGDANHIDKQDNLINVYPTEEWDLNRLLFTCFICQPAVFFRRRVFENYGLLDEKLNYCMDYEYWIRLAVKGAKFAHLPKVLAGSRFYAETKTSGSRLKVHKEINDMMKSLLGKVPERWLSNYAHVYVEEKITKKRSKKFIFSLVLLYLYSALKWNRSISKDMRTHIREWVAGGLFKR